MVCGRFIPAGTIVAIPQYLLQRDPRYFSDPDKFVPERWMPGRKEKMHKMASRTCLASPLPIKVLTEAAVPFSFGPYSCVGKQLAYLELRLVMTAILRNFDAQLPDDFDPEKFEKSFKAFLVLHITEKLPVIFTRRQFARS